MKPVVSVVIPVYNVAPWLDRCVGSVTSQSHTRLDIILVDDGSTDDSGVLCDAWAARDARVRVIHQANSGPSAARNAGLDGMRGDFVTFVDSDDWIHPDMVSSLLGGMEGEKATIAVTRFLRPEGASVPSPDLSRRTTRLTSEEALARLLGPDHTLMTIPCGKLFTRDVVRTLRFPQGRLHEDEFMAHQFLLAARQIILHDDALYFYFVRDSGTMGSPFTAKRGRDAIDADRLRADDLMLHGTADLATLAWQQFVRRVLKVLCWAVGESDGDLQRVLARELAELQRDSRWIRLPVGMRILARVGALSPQSACSLLWLRSQLSGKSPVSK